MQTKSQPCADSTLKTKLPTTLSLPSGSRTFEARAGLVNAALASRLARSSRLDRYMRVLKDKCPSHFGHGALLVPADSHRCTTETALPMHLFGAFKLAFSFERYTYCFQCCLPQSRNGNGEEPACHAGFSYRKGEKCPFAGFIFKTVFCMWYSQGFRQLMINEFSGASLVPYENFLAWIIQDSSDAGRYNNIVEVFLWFCSGIENAKPTFFD